MSLPFSICHQQVQIDYGSGTVAHTARSDVTRREKCPSWFDRDKKVHQTDVYPIQSNPINKTFTVVNEKISTASKEDKFH